MPALTAPVKLARTQVVAALKEIVRKPDQLIIDSPYQRIFTVATTIAAGQPYVMLGLSILRLDDRILFGARLSTDDGAVSVWDDERPEALSIKDAVTTIDMALLLRGEAPNVRDRLRAMLDEAEDARGVAA